MPRSHPDRRPPAGDPSGEAGATLIEVLVTTLLLAMVVGALFPILTIGQQGSDYARRRQTMTQTGRVALDKLIRELRAAESFRTLASGSVVLTFNYGDGTGAAPTVQYSLNGATHNLEYRWSADYDYREQITVTAGSAVPTTSLPYAVALTFNHAALVTAGKSLASGDDVRVRYWNGSSMVELDRVLDPVVTPPSVWNNTTTKIWFPLQKAIAAAGTDNNYYLYYGNLNDANPPAYGPNVFLDYQDGSPAPGTALDGWTRRDSLGGTPYSTSAGGFVFTEPVTSNSGLYELTKNVANSDVEIFWGFWTTSNNSRGNEAGVGARLSDASVACPSGGCGYLLVPGDSNNNRFRIYYTTAWGSIGSQIGSVNAGITTSVNYYGRFDLVGSKIHGKYWQASITEPAWQVLPGSSGTWADTGVITDISASSGTHYGQIDATTVSMNHLHSTMIVRPRVADPEPATSLGVEASGARTDALTPLAGPFRSLTVACFDATGASIPSCSPMPSVKAVQVTLVVMDASGSVPDLTLTGEALRERP